MNVALLPEADRSLLRDLTRPPRTGRFRCAFCGAHCWGRVCHAHRDLIAIEAEATACLARRTAASDTKESD